MSKGEPPRALRQSLQKSFATRGPPGRGAFHFEISAMPPLTKTCPETVCAKKGVAFL
jgi:hypothetical protein